MQMEPPRSSGTAKWSRSPRPRSTEMAARDRNMLCLHTNFMPSGAEGYSESAVKHQVSCNKSYVFIFTVYVFL